MAALNPWKHHVALICHHLLSHVSIDASINVSEGATRTAQAFEDAILCVTEPRFERAVDVFSYSEGLASAYISACHSSQPNVA